jgi:hypothetical protein
MARINPNDAKIDDNKQLPSEIVVTPGTKLLAPIGASYRYTAGGKKFCEIEYVILKNLNTDGQNETGCSITDKLFVADNCNWLWAKLAACLSFNDSFDNEDPQDVQNMLFRDGCRIKAVLENETYNEKTNLRIKNMGKVLKDGKVPPYTETELQLIQKRKDAFSSLLKWRSENGWKQDLLPMNTPNDPLAGGDTDFDDDDDWDTVPF